MKRRMIPSGPARQAGNMDIRNIIDAIRGHRVRITDHADEEATADRLILDDVYFSVEHGDLVEDYPQDRPYPSGLIHGVSPVNEHIHSVWAYNASNGWAVLVTVYRPDPARWIDGRIRRKPE
jgi:hypothetical protein